MKDILQFISNAKAITIYKCKCKAITMIGMNNEKQFSNSFMPRINSKLYKNAIKTYTCDHCCNHRGLDLCKCGSGKKIKQCKEKHHNCGTAAQELGVQNEFHHCFR